MRIGGASHASISASIVATADKAIVKALWDGGDVVVVQWGIYTQVR